MFSHLGAQVRPSWPQNAFRKLIKTKHVLFTKPLNKNKLFQAIVASQDGSQNALRSAQDGSKTVLERHLLDRKNDLDL